MANKRSFLPIFFLFLLLSLFVFFLSRLNVFAGLGLLSTPLFAVQGKLFSIGDIPSGWFSNKTNENLQKENLALTVQLVHMQQIEQENTALKDQFQTTTIPSSSLLPAHVIADPQLLPGVSSPESIVIDKGQADGIAIGDGVIYRTNLLGMISRITTHAALVTLVSNPATSFTAKTSRTNAQGVLSGQGNGAMVLGSVLLSDTLSIGDIVITGGSQDLSGHGIPPGLIVGKIISVSKTPSSLYQSASLQSLVQVQKLSIVFVLTH